tara:strand:+ start:497 stop:1573 length:1077 start_codon:yes stop_codon:yes gene_type:complete
MPTFNILRETTPDKSFRVANVIGKFDLDSNHIKEEFKGNLDIDNKDWKIGVIVGSSGSGKSTVAKELFPDYYIEQFEYKHKSILDDFDENLSVNDITQTFNSVGFSSPPSWLKPYNVLSQGEKMRVDLARALLSDKEIIVFDEFTSVVDRNVAKVGSSAISKTIKRRSDKKFIAVSCHYDILEWLEPDWIFDMNKLDHLDPRGYLRRSKFKLQIYEAKGYWGLFKKHHYLDHNLAKHAKQYVGFINNEPVCFCGVIHFPHPKVKNFKKVTRLVVLPDYQGLSIGNKMLNYLAHKYSEDGFRFTITTSTPALISSFKRSKIWKCITFDKKRKLTRYPNGNTNESYKRLMTSWEYINGET